MQSFYFTPLSTLFYSHQESLMEGEILVVMQTSDFLHL